MAQDIFSYIREAYASGMTKQEVFDALHTVGWHDADIYQSFAEYELSAEKHAHIQRKSNIPVMEDIEPLIQEQPFKKFQLKFPPKILATLGVIAASVAIVVASIGIRNFVFQPAEPAQFSLQAAVSDSEGISADTSFILKSSRVFKEEDIQKIITFIPAIEFSVRKTVQGASFIPVAYAAEDMPSGAEYEITPVEPLNEEKIYNIAVIDEDIGDKEYQWAFQVKAPFQVISTHPANHGTYVPLNTGIEIVFNREDVSDPKSFFEISPHVEGTFEQHKKTVVFLPKELKDKTVYTITLKKGIKVGSSGEVFEQDYTFSFETSEKEYDDYVNKPDIRFPRTFQEFVPGKKPIVEITPNYYFNQEKDEKKLEMSVFYFERPDDFLKAYRARSVQSENWTQFQQKDTTHDDIARSAKKIFSFKPKLITSGWQTFVEFPKNIEAGQYVFQLSYDKNISYEWAAVTPLTHYYALSGEKSFIWLYDFTTKKPIIGAAISAITPHDVQEPLGTSNQDGLLEFPTPELLQYKGKGDEGAHADFFKITHEKETIFIPASVANEEYASYWSYISSDRYTYQMTDTIRFWGILKGKKEDLKGKKAHVALRGGDSYTTIEETDVAVSQFDTVQGELSFIGATPGYYSLEFSMYDQVVQTIPIEIMTYTKPAYFITVTPAQSAVYADMSVIFNVKAEFFDGTPVSGAKLHYSGWWYDNIEGEIQLNENGEGIVRYTPKYEEGDYYPQTLELTFRPTLSEEGEIWGTGSVLVFGPDRYIQSFSENKGNDTYGLRVKVNMLAIENGINKNPDLWNNDFIGDPAVGERIAARVIQHTYIKKEIGQYYDPIDKITRKQYDYSVEDKNLEEFFGTTDAHGEWVFDKIIKRKKDSWYEVVFEGRDRKNKKFTSREFLWDMGGGYDTWKLFSISLEKKDIGAGGGEKKYSLGEKVQLSAQIRGEKKRVDSPFLFFRKSANIESLTVQNGNDYSDTFTESFIPAVQYRAVVLGPYGFEESNEIEARFAEKDRGLFIRITPDKEKYRPGDLVSLDISVKDAEKKGVSAEVNVAAVDEALYHMLPYTYEQNILQTLYASAQSNAWITTDAGQYIQLNKSNAEGGGCFTGDMPITMSDGKTKVIQDVRIGDRILTFTSEREHSRVPAVVQGISWHYVPMYLTINNTLKVTPEHTLFINGSWMPAGQARIGDALLGLDGTLEKVTDITITNAHTLVYNIVVGTYHTYFAGGRYVHNQEKGGGDMRVRQKFEDTALYESVHTNQQGFARTTFTAPDNVTSWRILAQGFAPDGIRAGQTTHVIPVSLPFFIDTVIAPTYLTGDEPSIRVRAFGDEFKMGEKTTFRIKSNALQIDKENTVDGNETFFTLGTLPEGTYEMTISGEQGSLQDAVSRSLDIKQSYFQTYESKKYDVSQSLRMQDGNKNGYTNLAFMDAGRGRYYDTLFSHTYVSGIRVDQVVTEYYAKKLLQDYFKEDLSQDALDMHTYQSFEKGGGIGLFPYSDPDLVLTAKITDLIPDAISKERARLYFTTALEDEKSDIHRISQALYGLSILHDPVLVNVQKVLHNTSDLTLEDRAYLALALVRFGDFASARTEYEKNIRNHLRFDGPQSWIDEEQDITQRVKRTGIIGIIASELGYESDAHALWEYMSSHDPERDLDSIEELLFMRSALEKNTESQASCTYQTSSRKENISLENGLTHRITLSADELRTMRFSNVRGNVHLVVSYEHNRNPDELQKNGELTIRRAYLVDGRPATEFKDGDLVQVRIDPNIAQSALDGTYQVVDYLPSGLKPITRTYELGLENTGTECDPTRYPVRIQNNAVYFLTYKGFDSTEHCTNRTINYYARVVTKGTYYANPVLIQSMENMKSLNVSRQDTVTIK
jgi:hypothetical protein